MLTIAVCDDEIRECLHFSRQLGNILDNLNVPHMIKQYNNGKQLLQAVWEFDIIFLDIIMCDMDGMKTAELLRQNFPDKILIFISSSRQYVFDAFAVEAFEYLVKPIEDGKLLQVLQRYITRRNLPSDNYILISKDRSTRKLFLDDIRYFEIHGRLIEAHGIHPTFSWYEQIGILETMLSDKNFFRCHKSYLVNLKYVDVYNRQEATLDNGEKILIAKRRYEAFCTAILEYMRRNGGRTT
ncbi:MAG: LytTR family DNA-binding domain-containing protein [Eubacterium sp.]|nr:LytTR family DNA-binding domain-containing protein [Eubacterium sp.]